MTILIKQSDFTKYEKAIVYLKNHPIPKVEIIGGIVSISTDNYAITIQTKTNYAVFDPKDVAAIDLQ